MAGVFVQSAPDVAFGAEPMAGVKPTAAAEKPSAAASSSSSLSSRETEPDVAKAGGVAAAPERAPDQKDIDSALMWLCRFPLEQNNPRATTGAVAVTKRAGILCVNATDTVANVFKILTVEGFLSAPVLARSGRYIGVIDLLDLVNFTVDLFERTAYDRSTKGWSTFFEEEKQFRETTVRRILESKKVSSAATGVGVQAPEYAVLHGFSTMHPLEVMAKAPQCRRVPVIDEKAHIVGLVTQSMMISLLAQNPHRLGSILDCKIKNVNPALVPRAVSVMQNSRVIDAFRLMSARQWNGLAVTNDKGHLVDAISVRDLRGIGSSAEKFHRLSYDVSFYKDLVRTEFPKQTPGLPLWVSLEGTLGDVLRLMDDGNIHRVFVCTPDPKDGISPIPIAYISQRDFLLILLKFMAI